MVAAGPGNTRDDMMGEHDGILACKFFGMFLRGMVRASDD